MKNKILYICSLLFLFVACNNTQKENDLIESREGMPYVNRDSTYQIEREQWERERRAAISPYRREGKYNVNDSIYLGEILILIDTVKRSVIESPSERRSKSYVLGGRYYSYNMYVSITNVSDSIELEIPFVFFEKSRDEKDQYIHSEAEHIYNLGTRIFYDKGKKHKGPGTNSYKIQPGKTRIGNYHMVNRGLITSLFFSFGDADADGAPNVPYYFYYYDDMKAYVDISSKIEKTED